MRKAAWLIAAFALMVTGIESLHVLVDWWQAGRPTPGMAVLLAIAALALVGVAWWRVSVFRCGKACGVPSDKDAD